MDESASLPEPARLSALRRIWQRGPNGGVQRAASMAFVIRITNAAIAYVSQILMARWMGAFEYGVYVYVWTLVLLVGTIADLGFAVTAQRFIPGYAEKGDFARLRGFISASRWIPTLFVTVTAAVAALTIALLAGGMGAYLVFPLYLACLTLPPYGLTASQDGVARSFGWINLALAPPFILRPLLLLGIFLILFVGGFAADATTAMLAAVGATWLTSMGQIYVLGRRLEKRLPKSPRAYSFRLWLVSALPILFANVFLFLLSYVGILFLQYYRSPSEIAVFYAATKVTAIVAMIYFAVSASATHKFAEFEAAGDRPGLARFYAASTRWMFWPSLLAGCVVLVCGKPLLWLFGEEFTQGYSLLFVIVAGLVIRTAIGPGESLLNMVGRQKLCAAIYAVAFAFNLVLCFALIPAWGGMGAAMATTASIVLESALIYRVIRKHLGIRAIIGGISENA